MGTESDSGDFRSFFEQKEKELARVCVQKEKELVDICEKQVKHLQQQILDRDKKIADLSAKFCSLKVDFKYNLELLDGRDAELSQYESELSSLRETSKEAAKDIQETHQKLADSNLQRLQDRSRAEEKDKLYQRTLLDIKGQMENLQLTREQLSTMHKQAFETACAELKSEVERKKVDMQQHSRMLEAQTLDKIRIQELQSQLSLDGVKNKLSVAETAIKQMERERDAADEEYSQAETQLRDIIRERDKIIKQLSTEIKQLQSEKDDVKSIADHESRKSAEQLRRLEAEREQQFLQMRLQIEDMQRRLDSAETRLARCGEQPGQIAVYLEKVSRWQHEMTTQGNEMNTKLESVEARLREAAKHQDEKTQELKTEAAWWKSQHDVLLSKSASQQKKIARGSTTEEVTRNPNFLQVPNVDIYRKQDLSTVGYNLDERRSNIANVPLTHTQHRKGNNGNSNSFGSSLPSPSPLPSPSFSNFEESFQLRQVNDISTQEDDVREMKVKDDYMPPFSEKDGKNLQLFKLAKENQGLKKSVQNLKDQNECMRSIVGTMRADMEALQKVTLERAKKPSNYEDLLKQCDKEDIKQLFDEVHLVASELQQRRGTNLEACPHQKPAQGQHQITESIQTSEKELKKPTSDSDDTQQSLTKIAELERVQKVLQMQLQSAAADIVKMTNERDCLMEISNSLHADFNRFIQQTNSKHHVVSQRNHDNLQHIQNPIKSTGSENSTFRGSKQETDVYTQSRSTQPKEEVDKKLGSHCLHLEGKMTPLKQRPEPLQDYVHKGIPSQRHKLKQSIKQQETQKATQVANRPKVRNYNITDDNDFQ